MGRSISFAAECRSSRCSSPVLRVSLELARGPCEVRQELRIWWIVGRGVSTYAVRCLSHAGAVHVSSLRLRTLPLVRLNNRARVKIQMVKAACATHTGTMPYSLSVRNSCAYKQQRPCLYCFANSHFPYIGVQACLIGSREGWFVRMAISAVIRSSPKAIRPTPQY